MPKFRKGPPSNTEIKYVRDKLALGQELEDIASALSRKTSTLIRHLHLSRPEIHPTKVNPSIVVTTAGGTKIEGLSLNELHRLVRHL